MGNSDLLYDALREKTWLQLLNYPKFDIKVKVADILKSFLYPGYITEKYISIAEWTVGIGP